jgi:hypothetical protein
MLGAIKVPRPPFDRIFNQLGDIRAREPMAAAALAGLSREHDPYSTHPPFGKRLANLGDTDIPSIEEMGVSAVDQLLAPDAAKNLAARFDEDWRKKAQAWVDVGK